MPSPLDLEARFEQAVRAYWVLRESQSTKQSKSGANDLTGRGAVTGGGHLNAVVDLVSEIFEHAGIPKESIKTGSSIELPGYFRPEKKWDLLVIEGDTIAAAIEFKSHAGPSFGNNYNNRIEEAIGSATDLWTAYREGLVGPERPWLGYFMLLEESPGSTKPVKAKESSFDVDPAYRGASYKKRYEVALQRLVLERLYDAACFVTAPRNPDDGQLHEPVKSLSMKRFSRAIDARAGYLRSLMAE